MSNSRNWTAQKDCPYTPGSVDVATGATAENPGDATFAQAFGAGPIDVYWALEDANDPPRSMAGIGSLSAGSIDVSSPSSTFDGTTYDDAPSAAITLTSPVTIRCTVNASEFDKRIYATDVTFENLNTNGDVGTGATQVAQGDHLHVGVYEPADATIIKQADVDDTPVNGATTVPVSSNWAFDHVAAADPHPGYLTPAEGNAAYLAIGAQAVDSAALGGVAASNYLQNITGELLSDLSDVTITTPANDQVLTYQAGVWVNQAAQGGTADLSNAEFPDSAHFAAQVAADATVAFTDGNKQSVNATTNPALTLTAPGVGSYILQILNSGSLSGITPTPKWDGGSAPTWGGTSILALYYDGTDWYGSAIVSAA